MKETMTIVLLDIENLENIEKFGKMYNWRASFFKRQEIESKGWKGQFKTL